MTRSVPQIIDGLRNAYGEHNTSEGLIALRKAIDAALNEGGAA